MTFKHTLGESIVDAYTLLPPEIDFIKRKNDYNRLAQAILLKYFQEYSRFPEKLDDIPQDALVWVSEQLGLSPDLIKLFDWQGRTGMRYRSQIRTWLGFRPNTLADQEELHNWLLKNALPQEHRFSHLEQIAYQRLKEQLIEPPTAGRMKRLVLSVIHQYEREFFSETAKRIPLEIQNRLRQLVHKKREIAIDESWAEDEPQDDPLDYPIHELRSDAGEAKVKTIKTVASRLKYLQQIKLPEKIFAEYSMRFLQQYAQRAVLESISHLH